MCDRKATDARCEARTRIRHTYSPYIYGIRIRHTPLICQSMRDHKATDAMVRGMDKRDLLQGQRDLAEACVAARRQAHGARRGETQGAFAGDRGQHECALYLLLLCSGALHHSLLLRGGRSWSRHDFPAAQSANFSAGTLCIRLPNSSCAAPCSCSELRGPRAERQRGAAAGVAVWRARRPQPEQHPQQGGGFAVVCCPRNSSGSCRSGAAQHGRATRGQQDKRARARGREGKAGARHSCRAGRRAYRTFAQIRLTAGM